MSTVRDRVWRGIVLAARIGVGLTFMAHGVDRLVLRGVDGTAQMLAAAGVPASSLVAVAVGMIELLAGAFLMVGLLLPASGTLLALVTLGAWWFVYRHNGFWAADGGYETALGLGAAALLVGFSGGGWLAADQLLGAAGPGLRQPRGHPD